MKISFEIKLSVLRATRRFASSDEKRYALNGVLFELNPDRTMVLVATNGRMIGCFKAPNGGDPDLEQDTQILVPNTLINAIPVNMVTLRLPITLTADMKSKVITARAGDVAIQASMIDAKFPTWREVMPKEWPKAFNAPELSANMNYFRTFLDAALELIDSEQLIITGGENNGPFCISGSSASSHGFDFFGCLMPVRFSNSERKIPDWINV